MLKIQELLKEKGISQIELAEKLGITPVGLNKAIKGNPTVDTLQKIADAIGVNIRDLFVYSGESETIYVNRGGSFIPIGEIKTNTKKNS